MGGMVSARARGARIPHLSHFHHGGIRSAMGSEVRVPDLLSDHWLLRLLCLPPSAPSILLPQSVPLSVLPARLLFQVFPPPSLDWLFLCSPAVHFFLHLKSLSVSFLPSFFLSLSWWFYTNNPTPTPTLGECVTKKPNRVWSIVTCLITLMFLQSRLHHAPYIMLLFPSLIPPTHQPSATQPPITSMADSPYAH